MISVLLIVVRILSLSAPLGGGLVSLNTHFETHNSYFLSVIVPVSLSTAREAPLNENRQLDKAIDATANIFIEDSFSDFGTAVQSITLEISILFVLSGMLMLGRAYLAYSADSTIYDDFAAWPVNAFTFMTGAVSQFFISSLFVVMLSYRLNQNLESIATIDKLTGVLNRRGLEDAAQKMQGICKRINLNMSVILIDVDHFKKVNDQHGHLYGDDVLKELTSVIANILRSGDVLGRYGGEEFCIFLPNTSEQDALRLAERIRAGVEALLKIVNYKSVNVTISLGVADSIKAGYDFIGLVAAADTAMYAAKNKGRNRVVSFTSL